MGERTKTAVISLRSDPALKERVEAALARNPYKPSLTSMAERGLELAMQESDRIFGSEETP